MADPTAREPVVIKLDSVGYIVPVGDVRDMISAAIWDADPVANPDANHSFLAALNHDHHARIVGGLDDDQQRLGRPMYFVRRRGNGNLELWPRCDQPYWFRATFRKPVKLGSPP